VPEKYTNCDFTIEALQKITPTSNVDFVDGDTIFILTVAFALPF